MQFSINLDSEVVDDLLQLTGAANPAQAVQIVVAEYVREEKLKRLRQLRGKVAILDNDELEVAETTLP